MLRPLGTTRIMCRARAGMLHLAWSRPKCIRIAPSPFVFSLPEPPRSASCLAPQTRNPRPLPTLFAVVRVHSYHGYFSMKFDTAAGDPVEGTAHLIQQTLRYMG
jgi:hypothetical protein